MRRRPGLYAPALLLSLLLPTLAAAQSRPTGFVSSFVDVFPNRGDTVELRARAFVEQKLEPSDHVRINLSGLAEGLVARRAGSRVDDAIFRAQEASIELKGSRVDLLAGFTRVAWGRLDELQPTDVINPLNVSRFFFEGRSEARLPVALVRGRVFITGDAVIEGIYVPVFRRGRFDQLDEPTSPFNLVSGFASVVEHEPSTSARNTQGGARFSATTGRVDWSLSAFRGIDPFGLYSITSPFGPLALPPPGPVQPPLVTSRFPRFTMLGGDFETVRGQWGIRGEVAAFVEDHFQDAAGFVSGTSIDAGVGVDRKAGAYRVSGTLLLHRERYDTPITPTGNPAAIEQSRTDVSLIASLDRNFAQEKYLLRLFGVYGATGGSAFARSIATAKLRDDLALEGSVGWFFGEGRDLIGRFAQSDFAYARLKYYF